MRTFLPPTLVLLLGCTACSVTPVPELSFAMLPHGISATEFPGANHLLHGFGARSSDAEWRCGDSVLFGLRLRRGETSERWLLHVVVTEPEAKAERVGDEAEGEPLPPVSWPIKVDGTTEYFRSSLCRVAVTVAAADGTVLAETHPLLPRDFLQHGFAPALKQVQRVMRDHPERLGRQEFYANLNSRALAEAVVCAVALVQVVQDDEVLSPILWQVVQRPPLLSVFTNFGVNVVIEPRRRQRSCASGRDTALDSR
jgi:tellurite resistance protein